MAAPDIPRKEIRFYSIPEDIIRMRMIGYNDFRYIDAWEFFRVYSWSSLHYVINGSGKLFIRGSEYDIGAGDFFYIPKNEAIMYYPDKDDPWQYYWVNFNGESQFNMFDKIGLSADNPVKAAKHPEKISNMFDKLFASDVSNAELYYNVLSVVMRIIALEYVQHETYNASSAPHDELVENAKKLITLNYSRADFSVSDIPEMLFVSQRHLGRLFRERVGMTPVAYLSEIRLTAASELLRKGDYTVSELCRLIGWGDELYFMKQFKRKFALTVREYRERSKRKPNGI